MSLEIYFETYGCTANKNSTEIMKGLVRQRKLEITSNPDYAELIIINSCIVKSNKALKSGISKSSNSNFRFSRFRSDSSVSLLSLILKSLFCSSDSPDTCSTSASVTCSLSSASFLPCPASITLSSSMMIGAM